MVKTEYTHQLIIHADVWQVSTSITQTESVRVHLVIIVIVFHLYLIDVLYLKLDLKLERVLIQMIAQRSVVLMVQMVLVQEIK